jgi:hypothetical protein
MKNAGMIVVAEMYLNRLPKFLPPEHHVRAVRLRKSEEMGSWRMHDVIVEGATLPKWPDQLIDPERVRLDVAMVHHPEEPRMGMFGSWMVDFKPVLTWQIKEWCLTDFPNGENGVAAALLEEFYHGVDPELPAG